MKRKRAARSEARREGVSPNKKPGARPGRQTKNRAQGPVAKQKTGHKARF
jgi:hypothetical protein